MTLHELRMSISHYMVRPQFILTMSLMGFLISPILSQSQPAPSIENNLYMKALFACLDAKAKAYSSQTNSRHDYYNVIVQQDEIITKNFPNQLGAYRIEYLGAQALVNRYKVKKAEFPIILIRPIENEGAKLVISFTDYFFSYSKKSLNYALEGGCNVVLSYDCAKQEYVIEKVDLWGI